MKTSNQGIDLIKGFEGLRLTAYKCSAGVWTIGYGHTKNVREGMHIPPEFATLLLVDDLETFEVGVSEVVEVFLHQYQFDALVSFAFNVGMTAFRQSTLLRRLNNREPAEKVAAEFLRWNKAGGKVVEGLTRRRKRESEVFLHGYGVTQ